jgi:phage pi2 protein 07
MNTNTAEIKNYLHKLIVETDDETILMKVQEYFTVLKEKNIDWWDMINVPKNTIPNH